MRNVSLDQHPIFLLCCGECHVDALPLLLQREGCDYRRDCGGEAVSFKPKVGD